MLTKVFLYGDAQAIIVEKCLKLLEGDPEVVVVKEITDSDVAIAPLLKRKIPAEELSAPRYGVLVFHPSLLPVHRGPDAIKWAFHNGEKYSGATWFWANEEYDGGDICEQEALVIKSSWKPKEFYEYAVIPASLRMLKYILEDLKGGHVRRRPQNEENATYERKYKKR